LENKLEDKYYNLIFNEEYDKIIPISNEMKSGILSIYFFKNDNIYVVAKWHYRSLYIFNIIKDGVDLIGE